VGWQALFIKFYRELVKAEEHAVKSRVALSSLITFGRNAFGAKGDPIQPHLAG
jgi:hypothetical protein